MSQLVSDKILGNQLEGLLDENSLSCFNIAKTKNKLKKEHDFILERTCYNKLIEAREMLPKIIYRISTFSFTIYNRNIYEYYDYILCCDKMMLNMGDKEVLFPKNFREEHDKITSEMIIATDSKINERISLLSKLFALNIYEDDKYIIFPASSVDSLIDESSQMSNCVRNYCIKLSNNECQIYFMRYKNNVNKSLVTIEVRDGKIVQARTRFNEFPTNEMNEILKKWEEQMIPITNKL